MMAIGLIDFVKHWEATQLPGSDGKSPRYWPGCIEMAKLAMGWASKLIDWPPKSVIELGCCDGPVLQLFDESGVPAEHCVGLTLFEEEAVLCRERGYSAYVASMHWHSLADASFDLVFSQRTIEHSPVGFYALYRMLKLAKRYAMIGLVRWPELVCDPRHYALEPPLNLWNWVEKLGGRKIGELEKWGYWLLIDTSGVKL